MREKREPATTRINQSHGSNLQLYGARLRRISGLLLGFGAHVHEGHSASTIDAG